MASKDYKSKNFTIASKKVKKDVLSKSISSLEGIVNTHLGYNSESLTDDDLFISMKLSWSLSDNQGLKNTFDYTSQNLIINKSLFVFYEDYFHLDLINSRITNDTNRYYIDGRVSYKFDGTFQLQCFYNILIDNQDGTKKVYTKELNIDHFKGTPVIINADKEYRLTISNPKATLSKIYLEYNTKEVSL